MTTKNLSTELLEQKQIQFDRDKCLFFWEKKKTPNSLIRQQENNLSIKLVERLKLKKKKKQFNRSMFNFFIDR